MNTTWTDLIDMMEGSLHAGDLASKALLNFANETNLPNIFHTLCTKSLYHRSWATRVNAANALHLLSEKFSQLIKCLINTTSSDGELFNLESIDIKSIISHGRELYSDDEVPRNPNKLYGKDWLQYQRRTLKKVLGMGINLTELKLCKNYESLDYLINVSDVDYKIEEKEHLNSENDNQHKYKSDVSTEVWIVRLLRFMISGLLDSKWETRHGCSLGLKGILSGLCPSFNNLESEESKKSKNNIELNDSFDSKLLNDGHTPLAANLESSHTNNNSMFEDISYSEEVSSWLPVFLVEDIISSGLCVMVLDRFVDFTITSSTVAPVRESCAQLVAYSSSIYSSLFLHRTLVKLMDMCCYQGHWTVNYGGLTALKYIIPIYFTTSISNDIRFTNNSSILSTLPSSPQYIKNQSVDDYYLHTIIDVIINYLKDSIVDDIICAAAKVIISFRYIRVNRINSKMDSSQNKHSDVDVKNSDQKILLKKLPEILQAIDDSLIRANDASTFIPYIATAISSCYHIAATATATLIIPFPFHDCSSSNNSGKSESLIINNISTNIPSIRKVRTNSREKETDNLLPFTKTLTTTTSTKKNIDSIHILEYISLICHSYSVIIKTILRLHVSGSTLMQCLEEILSTMKDIIRIMTVLITTLNKDSNSIMIANIFPFDKTSSTKLVDSVINLACDMFLIFDSSSLSESPINLQSTLETTTSSSCLLTKEEFKADNMQANKPSLPSSIPTSLHSNDSASLLVNNVNDNNEWRKLRDICHQLSIATVKLTSCTIILYILKLKMEASDNSSSSSGSSSIPLALDKDVPELVLSLLLIGADLFSKKTKQLDSECISSNNAIELKDFGSEENVLWKHLLAHYFIPNNNNNTSNTTNKTDFDHRDSDDNNRNDNAITRILLETIVKALSKALYDKDKDTNVERKKENDELANSSLSNKDDNRNSLFTIDYIMEWTQGMNFIIELLSDQSSQYDNKNINTLSTPPQSCNQTRYIPLTQNLLIKYQNSLWELIVHPLFNKLTYIDEQLKLTSTTTTRKTRRPLFTMTIGTNKVTKYSDNNLPAVNVDQSKRHLAMSNYLSNCLLVVIQTYIGIVSSYPSSHHFNSNNDAISSLPITETKEAIIPNIVNYLNDEKRIPQKYDNILQIINLIDNNDVTSLMKLAVDTITYYRIVTPQQSLTQSTLLLESPSSSSSSCITHSLKHQVNIKMDMFERLIVVAIINQFNKYQQSVKSKGAAVPVPVLWPPWTVCLPSLIISMLSDDERSKISAQLSSNVIYGVAKQLDYLFFENLFPLKNLFNITTNNSNESTATPAWCNFISPTSLIHLLSSALPALTSKAKLEVTKCSRLLGDSFFVSLIEFVCNNFEGVNYSINRCDIFASKITDVLVALVDVDRSFTQSVCIVENGTVVVKNVPLTSFTTLKSLAFSLGTFITTSRHLNVKETGTTIRSHLAANLLHMLTGRLGTALVRSNRGESSVYIYWLTATLAGISHSNLNVRRLCSAALRTLIPFSSLSTGKLDYNQNINNDNNADNGCCSVEYSGMSRASRIMERMLTTGSPSLLGTDPLDIPLLLKFHSLTGFSLPPGLKVNDNTDMVGGIPEAVNKDDLRYYQWEGISWITALRRCGLGALLADDMGLGKTLQTLCAVALLQLERESEGCPHTRCLVVCPAVLLLHWESEVTKFFPTSLLRVVKYTNERIGRRKDNYSSVIINSETMSVEDPSYIFSNTEIDGSNSEEKCCLITLASYASLRSRPSALLSPHWDIVVIDESHCCRNPHSQLSLALSLLSASTRIALSGTPVQNQVQELWSIMRFLIPDYLGDFNEFRKNYVIPIEKAFRQKEQENKQQQVPITGINRFQALGVAAEGMDRLQSLHKQVLPFILRRKKEEVLKELPPKTIIDVLCPLTPEQQELYGTMQKGLKLSDAQLEAELLRKREGINRKDTTVIKKESSQIHPLKALLYLSLLSVHPAIVITDAHDKYRSKLLNDGRCSGKMVGLAKILYESRVVQREECDSKLWEDVYVDEEGGLVTMSIDDNEVVNDPSDEEEEEEEVVKESNRLSKDKKNKKRTRKQEVDKKTSQVKPTKKKSKKVVKKSNEKNSSNDGLVTAEVQPLLPVPDYNEAAANSLPNVVGGGGGSVAGKEVEVMHKCLIFAKHRSSLDIIESCVLRRYFSSVCYARLDGTVAPVERASIAHAFNDSTTTTTTTTTSDIRILLLSTSSCGLGLNLTAADTVIFVEHSWNPFDDLQASDRVHRLGQTRPVTIYRLLAQSTVEERVLGIQGRKLTVVSELINEDNAQLMDEVTTTDNIKNKTLGATLFTSLAAKSSNSLNEVLAVPSSMSMSMESDELCLEYESLNVESFLTSIGLD